MTFLDPQKTWGAVAFAGLCSSEIVLAWQAKKAVANMKAAAAQVRSHTGCIRSPSQCERHDTHALIGNNL